MDINKDIVKTDYGIKREGSSQFIIIAPHAAGDYLKTATIAKKIARKTQGFLVINKKYFKPTNSKAVNNPDYCEDFNKLSWSYKYKKYLWKKKKPAMKRFFKDITDYCLKAKQYCPENKSVAVYIHGFNNEKFGDLSKNIGIDIGVGVKAIKHNRFKSNNKKNPYSGTLTIKIKHLKLLKEILDKKLKAKYNLEVVVGKLYPAWSKRRANQFHKNNRDEYAIQIEINKNLKTNKDDLVFISKIISESLINTFNN